MDNLLQLKANHKIIIGAVIGLVIIGGLAALLLKYLSSANGLSQQASKNPLQQAAVNLAETSTAVDPAQLLSAYREQSTAIINDFLQQAVNPDNLAASASAAQAKFLALKVPAQYKQQHVAEVLLLGEISNLSKAGQSKAAQKKLAEFKELAKQEQ